MSSYSITTSGPSPQLAMLRALALKAGHTIKSGWMNVQFALSRVAHFARTAATGMLAVAGSHSGYNAITRGVRAAISGTWRVVKAATGWIGRALTNLGDAVTGAVSYVSPAAAAWISDAASRWVAVPVRAALSAVSAWAGTLGEVIYGLSRTGLVRTATVTAAQAGSLVLAVHALSKGAVAAKVVSALPWLFDAVVLLTSPVHVLAVVAGVFAAACGIAFARLVMRPEPPAEVPPAVPAEAPIATTVKPVMQTAPAPEVDVDLMAIAARLSVDVAPDGSVRVKNILSDLPVETGLLVARIAADAAEAQLRKILPVRPTPSRDDRRLLVKVAREAVRAEARSAQHAA